MTNTISHHAALIYTMVVVAASDGNMSDAELMTIGDIVKKYPIFNDFDEDQLVPLAEECGKIMSEENGLKNVLKIVKSSIPEKLIETAYAVAVDVAAADTDVPQEQLRLLEMLRDALGIDRLFAGAIERAARARHMTL